MPVRYITCMRRGTKTQWDASNIIPLAGELVVEIDEEYNLHKLKIGDGIHAYSELAYLMAGDEVVSQLLTKVAQKVITVPLTVNDWQLITNKDDPKYGHYKQIVTIEGATKYSRLDLNPEASMLAEFQSLDLVFVTENDSKYDDDQIVVYAIGDKPQKDYSVQATIVETEPTKDYQKIVGATVGTPTVKDIIRYTPQALTEEQKAQVRENIGVSNDFILNSSTEGSTKKFKITVDDNGVLTANEVI